MSFLSLFTKTREARLPVAFLEHFRPHNEAWTLIAQGGAGRAPTVTFQPAAYGSAAPWIAKMQRQKRNVSVVMAELACPSVSGLVLVRGHLRGTRHIGVKLPKARQGELDAFKPSPFLRMEAMHSGRALAGQTIYAAWRLLNEVPIGAAEEMSRRVAERLGGVSLGHLLPVAGTIQQWDQSRIELVHLLKDRLNLLTDFMGIASEETSKGFVRATEVEAKAIDWLWPGVLPKGALSLIAGPGGVGKSTVAASIAATVTTGGRFPVSGSANLDGAHAVAGGVIFLEAEDDTASVTLPRLQAAGADLNRVMVGHVCDLTGSVRVLNEARKALGDVALLVLSPVRSFFGAESFIETTVRQQLQPVLAWAEKHGVTVLGVSHPPRGKRDIAGATAWRNLARAGLFVDRAPGEPSRRLMTPLKANQGRDDWALAYEIEGATLGSGIATSRIVWREPHSESVGSCKPQLSPRERMHIKARPCGPHKAAPESTSSVLGEALTTPAMSWLWVALQSGPQDAAELKREAKAAGISVGALYRAAQRLGVQMSERGFGRARVWSL